MTLILLIFLATSLVFALGVLTGSGYTTYAQDRLGRQLAEMQRQVSEERRWLDEQRDWQ